MSKVFETPVSAAFSPVDVLVYGTQTGVAASTLTTLTTHSALADQTVSSFLMSGTNYAKYSIFINSVEMMTVRTGPDRTYNLLLTRPLNIYNGDVLDVKVEHYQVGETNDFEASVLGV
jgi:hypothetical protein